MTYKEYRDERQNAFNELPIFWAFSNEQFREAMEKRGLTGHDTDKVYRLTASGFYLKADAQKIADYFNAPDPLPELMKDRTFAYEAILYEMANHEYCINWQGDYDVCSCFGEIEHSDSPDELERYFDKLGWGQETRQAYFDARRQHIMDFDG